MTARFRPSLLLLTLCVPLSVTNAQRISANTADLFKVLFTTVASEVANGKSQFSDSRAGTPAWSAWEIESSHHTGPVAEIEFQNVVLKANGARLRAPDDTLWTVLAVRAVEIIGNTAVVSLDRGTRSCSRVSGQGGSGQTYRYTFRRVQQTWEYASAEPGVAYNHAPTMPKRGLCWPARSQHSWGQ